MSKAWSLLNELGGLYKAEADKAPLFPQSECLRVESFKEGILGTYKLLCSFLRK